MPIPAPEELAAALRVQAPAGIDPAHLDELTGYLLTAYEAVQAYQPLSMRPVQAPWGGAALAFEASWPDTHSLVVATRRPPEQGSPAQLTLRRAGQLVYAVSSTPEHLATAVTLCLGRHIKRVASGEAAE
ncbi:hypothetical protein EJV47_20410 [Hymenobacter gummosus]|uniref:Uncharacterized protein n=1 Tax=Hymenobacter gummosus TaxID=1776032 RepID=A0A431TY17_9BACT|nr:hypothetical protein [Hymenobacter gummosus]RTQ46740.1 hypothetical protein EJV47_20410 [Hymenobacter gummosus]